MKSYEIENTNRPLALIITIVVHILLFIALYFTIIYTPLPPYPIGGGSGLEVNLGNSDEGMGNIQSQEITTGKNPYTKETNNNNSNTKANSSDNNILTQDNEDAPNLYTTKNNEEVIKIQEPVINKNALFKKNTNNSNGGSEGETGNSGDQGKTNGSPFVKNHYGDGGNGDGTGDGPGDGPGNGTGKGKGTSYKLGNRKANSLPKPVYTSNNSGRVVVAIVVDRLGNVISATPGVKGSTTNEKELINAAKRAALSTKFEKSEKSPEEQRGSITYNFILE